MNPFRHVANIVTFSGLFPLTAHHDPDERREEFIHSNLSNYSIHRGRWITHLARLVVVRRGLNGTYLDHVVDHP
jgi:hypothetical protein